VKKTLVMLFISIPILAFAIDAPNPKLVKDNSEMFAYVLGVCFLVITFFIHRLLNQIDTRNGADAKNNVLQWQAIAKVDKRLSHLEGAHESHHSRRRLDDPVGRDY